MREKPVVVVLSPSLPIKGAINRNRLLFQPQDDDDSSVRRGKKKKGNFLVEARNEGRLDLGGGRIYAADAETKTEKKVFD